MQNKFEAQAIVYQIRFVVVIRRTMDYQTNKGCGQYDAASDT